MTYFNKCSRCGNSREEKRTRLTTGRIKGAIIAIEDDYEDYWGDTEPYKEEYKLCFKCLESLKRWMKGEENVCNNQ